MGLHYFEKREKNATHVSADCAEEDHGNHEAQENDDHNRVGQAEPMDPFVEDVLREEAVSMSAPQKERSVHVPDSCPNEWPVKGSSAYAHMPCGIPRELNVPKVCRIPVKKRRFVR